MANQAGIISFVCAQCGKQAHRPYRGSGVRPTLCGNACKVQAYKQRHGIISQRELRRIAAGMRVFVTVQRSGRKPPLPMCKVCGKAFVRTIKGIHACSLECRAVSLELARVRSKASQTHREGKAASRKARKLRQRGVAVETVNPFKVLRRDGWRCQLCGIATPERLRGTYDDRAPEVDHIVPISKGGEHSYRNTQCACRKCNLAKSGNIKGQMLLFG